MSNLSEQISALRKEMDKLIDQRIDEIAKVRYHRRLSGSMSTGGCRCDCCEKDNVAISGFEKDYPTNPDIGLCHECEMRYYNQITDLPR
jgi:hypothetical protein